mgnify:CR=1 FL=1
MSPSPPAPTTPAMDAYPKMVPKAVVAPATREVLASTKSTLVIMEKLLAPMDFAASTTPASTSFNEVSTSLATKGDSITFSTPSIEGTVLCRNKPDANGKHPWKAEVTEGDTGVTAATINDWYNSVYEPTYATTSTQTSGK